VAEDTESALVQVTAEDPRAGVQPAQLVEEEPDVGGLHVDQGRPLAQVVLERVSPAC
jgi:hypothetical protein